MLLPPLVASPAAAQPVVTSAAPDLVEVTLYRDPSRSADEFIDLEEPLGGYALVTETRTVELPPGPVTIRFEGVASGIQPESAILRGVDAAEKNQDRLLLSRQGLLDAFTGQQVIVRRTDPATGRKTEEPARLRSGTNGVVIETAAGFESLYCTDLNQTPIFPGVPAGLSAKPVLSVTTGDQPGGRRQVTLSYLDRRFRLAGQLCRRAFERRQAGRPVRLGDPGEPRRHQLRQGAGQCGGRPGRAREAGEG